MTHSDGTWARVLIVDDAPPNVILLERMLEQWGYTDVVGTTNSAEVAGLCAAQAPDLILLDLQMPKPDGFELMEILRPLTDTPPQIPVLVLTADATLATRQQALAAGARDFLSKPFDPIEVRLRIGNLLEVRRLQIDLLSQNRTLEEKVRERTADLERARVELLERLALAAEYRDDSTQEHAARVGRTVAGIARGMGMPDGDVEVLRRAAPLHDIGKIGIPDTILLKRAPLTHEEFQLMKTHARIGAEILSGSEFAILNTAERIAHAHHERWDGGGYPDSLTGADIPLAARMVAVADVFDALAHERPYKEAWPLDRAVEEIVGLAGQHFDPDVVRAFAQLDHNALLAPIAPGGLPRPARAPDPLETTLRR
ncbi:MAG: cyclic di-GMP phosphodiesterase [Thermoleophilaceae bacterium]|nr:cyclic di-GMP phosphodiesterase [Thermoleophilaceae bacterium]